MPDDFIPYDETWGTFDSFCYTPPVFAYYDYRYTTSDGTEVFLRISSVHRLLDYELNDGSKDYSSKKPANRNDMRDFGKKIMNAGKRISNFGKKTKKNGKKIKKCGFKMKSIEKMTIKKLWIHL